MEVVSGSAFHLCVITASCSPYPDETVAVRGSGVSCVVFTYDLCIISFVQDMDSFTVGHWMCLDESYVVYNPTKSSLSKFRKQFQGVQVSHRNVFTIL
jgi:hypothetical protein